MRAIFITIILAALLGGGGVYLWHYYGGFANEQSQALSFIDAYGSYAETADRVETLVHMPGVEGNDDRAELFRLLTTILTESLTPTRREELARLAFNNLTALKKEIDGAQTAQAQLYERLQDLDTASRAFSSIVLQQKVGEVVTLARKRAELTARITAVLSEINDHTYAIVTRILADGGELTPEHVQSINTTTDFAEERSETLANLYSELVQKHTELETRFTEFAQRAM